LSPSRVSNSKSGACFPSSSPRFAEASSHSSLFIIPSSKSSCELSVSSEVRKSYADQPTIPITARMTTNINVFLIELLLVHYSFNFLIISSVPKITAFTNGFVQIILKCHDFFKKRDKVVRRRKIYEVLQTRKIKYTNC